MFRSVILNILTVATILAFLADKSAALCTEENTPSNVKGEYKVIAITHPEYLCSIDEQGALRASPIKIQGQGCLITLKKIGKDSVDPYVIYEDGNRCDLSLGKRLKLTLESTAGKCCSVVEASVQNMEPCSGGPSAKFIKKLSYDYLQCNNGKSSWKIQSSK